MRLDYEIKREQAARVHAKQQNMVLLRTAKTKFKIGDEVMHGKDRVVITEVHPRGYISIPGGYACYSSNWIGPVTCDVNIYRYKIKGSKNMFSGQTTEDRLSAIQ